MANELIRSEGLAIELEGVAKIFKKTSKRKEFTTLKSELVRILTGRRQIIEPSWQIEALRHVDLAIPRGQTVGIIGRNGSGKSTLLKLITGIYAPTRGRVSIHGRISALLELGAGFHPDFTGRENILINGIILGMSRAQLKDRMEGIIEFAELGEFIDEPVRAYSSGMFMRLAFAVATHVDPDILIIDEILSVGDEHFQRKSEAKMNEFRLSGRTIVLVTHGLSTVESWCDSAVWIDGGTVRMQGPPREVVAEYRRAIVAAEEQAQRTGHSALSAPGLALPAPAAAPTPTARLTGLRLEAGELVLAWASTQTEPQPLRLSVEVLGAGGELLESSLSGLSLGAGAGELRRAAPRLAPSAAALAAVLVGPGASTEVVRVSLDGAPRAG
jgi:lipopolysaccharide transport system ATP-binding protein